MTTHILIWFMSWGGDYQGAAASGSAEFRNPGGQSGYSLMENPVSVRLGKGGVRQAMSRVG